MAEDCTAILAQANLACKNDIAALVKKADFGEKPKKIK